jgi:hypothetical protein
MPLPPKSCLVFVIIAPPVEEAIKLTRLSLG